MIPVILAVEDVLSERILRRLLETSGRNYQVSQVMSRGGFGYLRSKIAAINKSAKALPFVVLTDLDNGVCASGLIQDWLQTPQNPNLIFRVAVREVEAWLLGDREGFSRFLKVSPDRIPEMPELLPDPKQTLVEIAARSGKSDMRRRLVPHRTSNAKVGREYNDCLGEFIANVWNPRDAGSVCPSLAKCIARLSDFEPTAPEKS
jgi:hypothetical protein